MSDSSPDSAFADRRLASLYDAHEVDRQDLVHYARIAHEFQAKRVLDLGCGTGTLACALADQGHEVIGVDPAKASLDFARAKLAARPVQWILGDVDTASSDVEPASMDLALMTGNVAQVFVSDTSWKATLASLHSMLRLGGHLVFEVRDPAYRGWEEWTKDHSHTFVESPAEGRVETWVDLVEVALPLVTFRWTYRFERDGSEMHSESTLVFRERSEVEVSLVASGYKVTDVRDAPDRPGKEFVFIAQAI